MSKTLWHTIQIKVPAEMVELTKSGKISIKKTLTKTFNISRSQKMQAIKLIPANVNHPSIINEGKEWDVNELKLRMKKAHELQNKNKGKDIYKQKKTYKTLNKFENNIVKRARELGKKDKLLKFGDIQAPNQPVRSYKGRYSEGMYNTGLADMYKFFIEYYWENAYKYMKPQDVPTQDELKLVSRNLYTITKKYHKIHTYYSNGNVKPASELLDSVLKTITDDEYKIIMKIAYHDGLNKNHKVLYKSCNIHKKKLEDEEEERMKKVREHEAAFNRRTPEEIQKNKDFWKKMNKNEIIMR